jgi:hypothetical protein
MRINLLYENEQGNINITTTIISILHCFIKQKKPPSDEDTVLGGFFEAEREGFEPPETFASTVFKTAALNRSAISPTDS